MDPPVTATKVSGEFNKLWVVALVIIVLIIAYFYFFYKPSKCDTDQKQISVEQMIQHILKEQGEIIKNMRA